MDIKLVQKRLNEVLKISLDIDALIGPKTLNSIKQFQKSKGLEVDGKIGPKTIDALFPESEQIVSSKVLKIRAMEIALSKEGVREATGKNDGPEVELYLKSVGLGKGYSWCQAFLYWCYEQAAIELNVPNPMTKTAGVLFHWSATKGKKKNFPSIGDIFIMDFGAGAGHTGIVTKIIGNRIDTIEGNTNSQNSREGNGIYERNRSISTIKGFIEY